MPPVARATAAAHLATTIRRLEVPLIDGRGWVPDECLPDGFHLTQTGAAAFTSRLATQLDATFGDMP